MNAAGWVSTITGIGLLGLVALDVSRTILHSRGRSGLVTETLTRAVWRLVGGAAFRRPRPARHRLLNHVGPLLLPITVATLVALLIFGYALLYWRHLPADFNVDEKAQSGRGIEKSLPRMLFLVLESCAVTRACLDTQVYEELCRHPELRTLEETGRHVLSELARMVGVGRGVDIAENEPGRAGVPTIEEPERWRQRYESTLRRLRDSGVRLPVDTEMGWREYRHRRHAWELELAAFALYLGYDWEEVTGDGDLRLAVE
jgi:hypothetical protein